MQSLPESGVRGTLMHNGLAGSKALSASKARAMRTTCANYPRADEREGLGWLGQAGEQLLERGERHHPYSQPRGHAQGNAGPAQAKHKAHKLLRRLHPYRGDVWRFMTDAGVPFTNHLAEQALRMAKVRQKVWGCFARARARMFSSRSACTWPPCTSSAPACLNA